MEWVYPKQCHQNHLLKLLMKLMTILIDHLYQRYASIIAREGGVADCPFIFPNDNIKDTELPTRIMDSFATADDTFLSWPIMEDQEIMNLCMDLIGEKDLSSSIGLFPQ
jgi:hypothetical protein